ncbi:MAG: hypothetical protein GXP36_14520 [Actinobacteria bacterium]|nr:hypothetical protein [Actinomycetota bacterium]
MNPQPAPNHLPAPRHSKPKGTATRALRRTALMIAAAIVVAACGGGTDTTTGTADDPPSPANTEARTTTTTTAFVIPENTNTPGSATLTVGDQTWEFDNYYCVRGIENTGNSRVSFSSGAFGEFDGANTQLDATILDMDELSSMEGDGTIHSVTIEDIDNVENPIVSLSAQSGFFGTPGFEIAYDGNMVTAKTIFDDDMTEEIEAIPGTLTAVCGS